MSNEEAMIVLYLMVEWHTSRVTRVHLIMKGEQDPGASELLLDY